MNARRTVIAVHVPKTAGTSFRAALEAAFGEQLRLDYGDHPMRESAARRRLRALGHAIRTAGRPLAPACIYGHFLPLKYAFAREADFTMWLRDPVDRVLSRYHHYRRAAGRGGRVHERWGLRPGLTVEEFVRVPHYRDLVHQYLWGIPLRRFGFVGLVEHWEEDYPRFFRHVGRAVPPVAPRLNRNPDAGDGRYAPSRQLRALIEAMNPRDVRLYRTVQARRLR